MGVIVKPIITEKMTQKSEKLNQYGFIVQRNANKLEIKAEIQSLYGVTVKSVNTILITGKNKSRYTKAGYITGRTNTIKKAIITLAEGETIDFYSNI
ncbi:MAG: 50S ribosomal protein L23 [Bacteroidetes bacterium]|nr:50S ribosomal protein L23 [Bacteroidota bacterium]